MKTTKSIWYEGSTPARFPSLQEEIDCDVVIVGGGITGITSAYLLSSAGLRIVVIEAMQPGQGTTGNSTGNLYCTIDSRVSKFISKYNKETASHVLEARTAAMDLVESITVNEHIDCSLRRVPWGLIAEKEEDRKQVQDEYEALKSVGIDAQLTSEVKLPIQVKEGVIIPNQLQINPLAYISSLATKCAGKGVKIFGNTAAESWEESDSGVIVSTKSGKIRAGKMIMATHTPKGIHLVQTLLGPYREFGVTAATGGPVVADGIWWVAGTTSHHSLRNYRADGKDYLIAIGEHFKTGQMDNTIEGIEAVKDFLKNCGFTAISHAWGAQHYKPADGIPYIGTKDKDSRIWHATGFSADGLTYGTMAAMIMADQITGRENQYAEMFALSRHQPGKAAGEFLKENINVAGEFIKGLFAEEHEWGEIAAGEGKITEVNDNKVAAYRDEEGNLHLCSAYCTHLKCVVNFNQAEKSWDCPCHGSRFDVDGKVIEGPAVQPLQKVPSKGGKG